MPPIDQNLISPLKFGSNDFTPRTDYITGTPHDYAYNVEIGTQNSSKFLIKGGEVLLYKTGINSSIGGKEEIKIIINGLYLSSNLSKNLLSPTLSNTTILGTNSVTFKAGQTTSSDMSNVSEYRKYEIFGPLRVKPKKLEILDEEVKLQAELYEFLFTSYSYDRRKEELQTLQNFLNKIDNNYARLNFSSTIQNLTPQENQALASVIPSFALGLGSELAKLGYKVVSSAIKKVLNAERSQQILRASASNQLKIVDINRKPVEISVTSKGLNIPQVEMPVGKITIPSYAQFNGSKSYLGISPFFSLPVELENATVKTEKNSVGQDVLILKGKGTNLNLSDILPSFPGSAAASKFFKVSYDFSEPESYISIGPGETRYVGRFSAEGVIIPGALSIRKASTLIDSSKNTYDILGEVGLPWAKDYILGARFRVVEGKFDAIALKADNLNIAVGSSGVFLQRIEGGVSNLARGGFPTISAGIGITFGKSFDVSTINIPYIGSIVQKAAGAIAIDGKIYMARADADVGIDASRFGGTANLKLLGGVVDRGQVRFSYNYKKSEALFDIYTNLLGIATVRANGMVNSDRTFLAGYASLQIPDIVPKFGGINVANGYALLNFINDGNYSNDYIAAWTKIGKLPDIGGKFRFDGNFELLTGNDINPLKAAKDNQEVLFDEKIAEELAKTLGIPFKSSRLPLARTVVEESLPEAPAQKAPDDPALAGFAEDAVFENSMVEAFDPLDTPEETDQIDETVEEIAGPSTDDPLTEEPDAELVSSDETEPSQEDEDEAELYDIEAGNNSEVTYGVTGGKYFMFTVSWENSASLGSVPFEVIGPDGTVYSSDTIPIADNEEEYTQPWKVGIIGELSDDKQLTILVKKPEIGEWTLSMTDTDTLGALEYGGSLDAPDPTIRFNSIDFDATTSNVNINYQAADPDSQATITFFYDTDGTGKNGTPISEELVESDGQGNFSWNATDLPSGEYYVYAMLQDNDNAPRFVYAPNPVTVIEPGSLSRVTDVGASSVGEDTVLVSWEPVEGAAYYIVDYDTNAAGSEVDRIEDSTMVAYDDNAVISGLKAGETYRFTVTAVDEQDDHSLPSLAAIAKVGGGSVEDMASDEDEWSVYATPGNTYTETIPVPFEGSVTLLEAPQGVALNPTTGEFTWNVPTDAYGWYNVRVLQTDNSNETSVYDFDLFAGTPPEAEGDVEIGSTGDDNLIGNADDDLLASGGGNDQSAGGDGDDEMYGNGGDDQLIGEAGGDDMQGGQGNDAAFGGADDDFVDGDNGDDKLYGNVGEDQLMGGQGNDEIRCGQDDDTAFGNEGSDQMYGDLGNDILAGGKNNDLLDGGVGDDEMSGGMDDDNISGGAGDDMANGNAGNDFIDGGEGNDELSGGQGNDTLAGGAGDDNLYGDKGNDSLAGGDGNNFLQGANEIAGPEIDTLIGGAGEDYFSLGEDAEPLYSAFGNDDYVLIQNFEFDKDSLILPGNPDSYELIDITAESNLPAGIGLSYVNFKGEQDLVAILAGVTDINAFTGNSFTFLNSPPEPATT